VDRKADRSGILSRLTAISGWTHQLTALCALAASICLSIVIGLSAQAGAKGASVVYTGHISADDATRVKLKVNGNRATFDPGKVPLQCADGTAAQQTPGVVKVRLDRDGKFETYRSVANPRTNSQAFYFVEGQVVSRSRAKGHLFLFVNFGVGISGESGLVCNTFAAESWKAFSG
jgi:hypothetical protein